MRNSSSLGQVHSTLRKGVKCKIKTRKMFTHTNRVRAYTSIHNRNCIVLDILACDFILSENVFLSRNELPQMILSLNVPLFKSHKHMSTKYVS